MAKLSEDNKRDLLALKADDITRSMLIKLLGRSVEEINGKITSNDPKMKTTDEFLAPAGSLPNIKKDTMTTVGRYIINLFVVTSVFHDRIPYVNYVFHGVNKFQNSVIELILADKATTDEFIEMQNRMFWLGYFPDIVVNNMSDKLVQPLPEVMEEKKRLLEKYKVEIAAGDTITYADKVEKPLLALAKKVLEKEDSFDLYAVGAKPSFKNNYKNMFVSYGPIFNPIDGTFTICTNSLAEGIPQGQRNFYANSLISGSYARGKGTQVGGGMTKLVDAGMQHVVTVHNTDCKSTDYVDTYIDPGDPTGYLLRYIKVGSSEILLTNELIPKYFGKTVKMRSPNTCKAKGFYCNKCVGDLPKQLNFTNVGYLLKRVTSTVLNMSLKSMHDSTIQVYHFNPLDYLEYEGEVASRIET